MNKEELKVWFEEVSVNKRIRDTAIIEKDYYVVQLLSRIGSVKNEHYSIVFSGGTSLTKMDIGIDRVSEDVDIKLIPKDAYLSLSGNQKRKAKKNIRQQIIDGIALTDGLVALTDKSITRDTGRYYQLPISYDNQYDAPDYMRTDIKLELIETDLLAPPSVTPIYSMVATASNSAPELDGILTNNLAGTQAEKILSLLRRTAAHARDSSRQDDETLTRHVYDCFFLAQRNIGRQDELFTLFQKATLLDIERYGNQSSDFTLNPAEELRRGLEQVENNPLFEERYNSYVLPMVYGRKVTWDESFSHFKASAESLIRKLDDTLGSNFDPAEKLSKLREKDKSDIPEPSKP